MMSMDLQRYDDARLPFFTAELPGIGGEFKQHNDDFVVEELPLYLFSGRGEHVLFEVEKEGLTTFAANQSIARAMGREQREIGFAGLKDAHGITRQWLSLDKTDIDRIRRLRLPRLRVLSTTRHTNKLKLGHLRGNRFVLKIRGVHRDAAARAEAILEVLVRRGCPNYFGPQRFGARGDNALIGLAFLEKRYPDALALILGRPDEHDHGPVRKARELFDQGEIGRACATWPSSFQEQVRLGRALLKSKNNHRRALETLDKSLSRLFVSAVQSEYFNQALARRIQEIDHLLEGDVAWNHQSNACFPVEQLDQEQIRCRNKEISPTGPLFGRRMMQPSGAAAKIEVRCPEALRSLDGERRSLRVVLSSAQVNSGKDQHGGFLQVLFDLPAGAYATSVLRELCREQQPRVRKAR